MSQRSWFFVHDDQASGPLSDTHIRTLLANGAVTPATLVWTEGMTEWGKASDIPELWPGGAVPPPIPAAASSDSIAPADDGTLAWVGGPWEIIGRGLLFLLGLVLVVPGPWAANSYYRWLVSRLHVPGRPHLTFIGQPKDIWYVFVGLMTSIMAGRRQAATGQQVFDSIIWNRPLVSSTRSNRATGIR